MLLPSVLNASARVQQHIKQAQRQAHARRNAEHKRADPVAVELRLRLKYAGVDETKIQVYYDYDPLIDAMCASEYPVFIMPTYTSMLDLRGRLQKQLGGKEFWE